MEYSIHASPEVASGHTFGVNDAKLLIVDEKLHAGFISAWQLDGVLCYVAALPMLDSAIDVLIKIRKGSVALPRGKIIAITVTGPVVSPADVIGSLAESQTCSDSIMLQLFPTSNRPSEETELLAEQTYDNQ